MRTSVIASIALTVCAPVLAAVVAPGADDAPIRLFMDDALDVRAGRLVSIAPDSVTMRDEAGRVSVLARARLVAILPQIRDPGVTPPGDATAESATSLMELADEQWLPGELGKDAPSHDSVSWRSTVWGVMSVPLDSVRTIAIRAGSRADPRLDGRQDTVLLTNDDVAGGFVASVGPVVRVEQGDKKLDIPIDRVAAIRLADSKGEARGVRVWLSDGSVVRVSDIAVGSAGKARLSAPSELGVQNAAVTVDANECRAVLFDAARLRALAGCAMSVKPVSGERRWLPPVWVADARGAALGLADMELPGPMQVEWTLPEGSERISMEVILPESSRTWGDYQITLEADGGQVAKAHLNAQNTSAVLAVSASGAGHARVRLEAGASGPVQDRALLRRACVLTR